ncbi:hypothetical protein [Micromonospora radicis]|nr:hypothetical protein [Micromonospora radicis]
MIKATPLPQTYITKVAGIGIKPEHRRKLIAAELIEVAEKPITLKLTDKGWHRAAEELGGEPPKGAGAGGGTLYVVLDFLRRLIDHSGTRADDLFRLQIKADDVASAVAAPAPHPAPAAPHPAAPAPDSAAPAPHSAPAAATGPVEAVTRVRQAYHELAAGPGAYVMLADLRTALADLSRAQVDTALVQLNRERNVHLVPESNQKVLKPQERAAAVSIGNQDKHLIAISS